MSTIVSPWRYEAAHKIALQLAKALIASRRRCDRAGSWDR